MSFHHGGGCKWLKRWLIDHLQAIKVNMEKLATDSKHRKSWGMELGLLDEERIKKEDFTPTHQSVPLAAAAADIIFYHFY